MQCHLVVAVGVGMEEVSEGGKAKNGSVLGAEVAVQASMGAQAV